MSAIIHAILHAILYIQLNNILNKGTKMNSYTASTHQILAINDIIWLQKNYPKLNILDAVQAIWYTHLTRFTTISIFDFVEYYTVLKNILIDYNNKSKHSIILFKQTDTYIIPYDLNEFTTISPKFEYEDTENNLGILCIDYRNMKKLIYNTMLGLETMQLLELGSQN
jgi:hypothetical protein